MPVCSSPWGTYELDPSWNDQSTHIFRSVAGGRAHTLVIHRDPAGAGVAAEAYAAEQTKTLAASLPGFAPEPAPALPGGPARAWAYTWRSPKGSIAQIQAVLPSYEAAVVFTLTGVPDIDDHARANFLRTVLSTRPHGA
jgi:hypothetical protein